MIRNEYRRAFIMLRAVMQGYGGHVRLERRTLTGSMYFIITAPQGVGELSAALVGQQNGAYYAAPIGALSRDRRGQLTLAWQFDPRSIEGRPLEAYPWVAVVATGGPCALALTGNVEGSRAMDAQAMAQAACALFAPAPGPAADLPDAAPDPVEPPLVPEPGPEAQDQCDVRVYTPARVRLCRGDKPADTPSETPVPQPEAPAPQPEPSVPQAETPTPQPEAPAPQPEAPASQVETPAPQPETPTSPEASPFATAARRLGLDITTPWPGAAEPIRRLFATQAPASDTPEDGYAYVRAPMPDGSGYPESLVGLKAEEGRITGMRYALPGRRAPEPPAGLENYRWFPADGELGFWVTEAALT